VNLYKLTRGLLSISQRQRLQIDGGPALCWAKYCKQEARKVSGDDSCKSSPETHTNNLLGELFYNCEALQAQCVGGMAADHIPDQVGFVTLTGVDRGTTQIDVGSAISIQREVRQL
jgi:hypothetical protein